MGHWQGSGGRDYNPDRANAFERVKIVSWYQDVLHEIEAIEGIKPEVFMTSARKPEGQRVMGWSGAREAIARGGRPKLVAFGTGFGMTEELLSQGDVVLDPINPEIESGYNHLSVRSAVAIALDRLLGKR